jgi:hypothetical protein
VQRHWLSSNICGMLFLEMPFEHTTHSFEPLQHWNISFLQGFDIWEQPKVILMKVWRTMKMIMLQNYSF